MLVSSLGQNNSEYQGKENRNNSPVLCVWERDGCPPVLLNEARQLGLEGRMTCTQPTTVTMPGGVICDRNCRTASETKSENTVAFPNIVGCDLLHKHNFSSLYEMRSHCAVNNRRLDENWDAVSLQKWSRICACKFRTPFNVTYMDPFTLSCIQLI